jgi:hypothetical protein
MALRSWPTINTSHGPKMAALYWSMSISKHLLESAYDEHVMCLSCPSLDSEGWLGMRLID